MWRPVSDIRGLQCLLCGQVNLILNVIQVLCDLCDISGQESRPYLGQVTTTVQAHPLCIKFAKGIKDKKSVVGKTRLQVNNRNPIIEVD